MRRAPLLLTVLQACLWGLLGGCGQGDISISLDVTGGAGPAAFADPQVADVVVTLTSIPGSLGKVADANKDSVPDTYVFPTSCGQAQAALCGYAASQKSTAKLGGIPKGFIFQLTLRFRGGTGTVLYEGSAEVNTAQVSPTVSVDVVKK